MKRVKIDARTWSELWSKLRGGARELGGARGFLRAARRQWYMWASIIIAIVVGEFWLIAFLAVCAMFGATCMDWTLEGYKKMLDGYGTMVDQQQGIIGTYQHENNKHPSEKAATDRLGRMN